MEQSVPAVILDRDVASHRSGRIISINLGESDRLVLSVWDAPARLSDVVPVAREVASRLARAARQRFESKCGPIACGKGCSTCCEYLVPLSVPEVFRLIEDVQAMPPACRETTESAFGDAARRIVEASAPEMDSDSSDADPGQSVGQWYSQLGITCPMLKDNLCDSYAQRPLACREHMVSTPAAHCVGFDPGNGSALETPFSVLDLLCDLSAELEGAPREAVMMPIALQWARLHPRRAERTWPARELFTRFADRVHEMLQPQTLVDSAVA